MKNLYLDLMETTLKAYTVEHIRKYTESVVQDGLSEHGFPRLTANLGILIAHGKKTELTDDFVKMMDLCCAEFPTAYEKKGWVAGNEFSVKEVVFCLLEVEKAGLFDKSVTDRWRKELAEIDPYKAYWNVAAILPPERINNWAAFAAASEQARKYAGIGNESIFIDEQVESQLSAFDENGMYRDPSEPIAYDFVTRLQLAFALFCGYDGKHRKALEDFLMRSADLTLDMQSVTGEIPYGGRSIQFLHNETLYAALCEYYAVVFKKKGDLRKAGRFKSAARRAVECIIPWLSEDTIRHIKNYYPIDSMYGCEFYGYFDKYMITAASWLYRAYVMADDSVEPVADTIEEHNCICETSQWFHKVFCRYNDYFVEVDTKADMHRDASGIGRIQKKGAPSTICLSVPFSAKPQYTIDIENPSPFSICGGIKTAEGYVYTYDDTTEYTLLEKHMSETCGRIKFACKMACGKTLYETCTVSDDGVTVQVEGEGELCILFPTFAFDGKQYTETVFTEKSAEVIYKGYRCRYVTSGKMEEKNDMYANRNGHYKAAAACGENSVTLQISIDSVK